MQVDEGTDRLRDVRRFYAILDELRSRLGGPRLLETADGSMSWPRRGVYFFFEPGEERTTSGAGPRVVRVGTHALKAGSDTTLWGRLRMHRGSLNSSRPGGGDHRGSVFRLHVGTALIRHDHWAAAVGAHWAEGSSAPIYIRNREYPRECSVSQYIRHLPFLWLEIDDAPGPDSRRAFIEANAIALLSNRRRATPIDPATPGWLGRFARNDGVCWSGLWNDEHTNEEYAPEFLDELERYLPGT